MAQHHDAEPGMVLQGGSVPNPEPKTQSHLVDSQPKQLLKQDSQASQEIHLHVLRYLNENPDVTQRKLAAHLGVSLGKVNYCLKALIQKGWVKANNFKNSNNKSAYVYLLTPKGIDNKAKITTAFLKRKIDEYELLRNEIDQLRREVNGMDRELK